MRVTAALLLLAGPALAGSYRPPPSLELLDLRGQVSFNPTPVNASLIPPRNPGGRPKDCPPCFNLQVSCGLWRTGLSDTLTAMSGTPAPTASCASARKVGAVSTAKNDKACKGFKLRNPVDDMLFGQDKHKDKDGDKDGDGGDDEIPDMVCYQGGVAIERNFQMCDVTNRKIRDTIPDNKPPQVTFSCEAGGHHANGSDIMSLYDPTAIGNEKGTCGFQFWVDRIESFYCKLTECTWELDQTVSANETHYKCENIECACVPGRFLCGENGSVNIDDFLTEEVRGPGSFNCISGKGCTFEEPAMNKLINDIFGDSSITLDCESGECVHYSQVPGYVPPAQPDNTKFIALMGALSVSLFLAAFFWYMGRNNDASGFSGIKLPEDEAARLMAEHVPATLHFSNISYTLPSGKHILEHVTGTCRPGEVLAIMGASGAGKSTLLDILARKSKTGKVSGEMYVNGRTIDNSTFRRIEGFVDQEDTLLPTLTVYETVLFSALLRLPREMSYEAKVYRTLETMNELGILGIRDARIGESGKRSISGGEKRRVSIACELVTGPSILFLDEPTSGLDSYNAYNVIDALKTLAKQYNRTVIFTIHQPQSNIVALFDRLLILAKGQLVFSGKQSNAQAHFESNGYPCPPGYNIADYVIDVTVDAAGDARKMTGGNGLPTAHSGGNGGIQDPEAGFSRRAAQSSSTSTDDEASVSQSGIKMKAAKLLGAFTSTSGTTTPAESVTPIPEALASLVLACRGSDDMKIVEAEVHRIETGETPNGGEQRDIAEETAMLKGYDKAGFWTQFKVLSGRAFRNLYRNPMLMAAHYAVAICAGFLCGFFFYHVTNDIPGFQ
ncbi:ATP-dependent permease [Trichosporon asahii var. asahii CBS 8904]|uniref:ATP-dependent permease n=1 Tax=Trichosporon asahii var. asahii (strain CBS 8904) TaxID=1220162 RepID=K1V2H6_TRIAC|nr:ATP-dependent permease [Trichosporon asahii var. asahii CBS 8904]